MFLIVIFVVSLFPNTGIPLSFANVSTSMGQFPAFKPLGLTFHTSNGYIMSQPMKVHGIFYGSQWKKGDGKPFATFVNSLTADHMQNTPGSLAQWWNIIKAYYQPSWLRPPDWQYRIRGEVSSQQPGACMCLTVLLLLTNSKLISDGGMRIQKLRTVRLQSGSDTTEWE